MAASPESSMLMQNLASAAPALTAKPLRVVQFSLQLSLQLSLQTRRCEGVAGSSCANRLAVAPDQQKHPSTTPQHPPTVHLPAGKFSRRNSLLGATSRLVSWSKRQTSS